MVSQLMTRGWVTLEGDELPAGFQVSLGMPSLSDLNPRGILSAKEQLCGALYSITP